MNGDFSACSLNTLLYLKGIILLMDLSEHGNVQCVRHATAMLMQCRV